MFRSSWTWLSGYRHSTSSRLSIVTDNKVFSDFNNIILWHELEAGGVTDLERGYGDVQPWILPLQPQFLPKC